MNRVLQHCGKQIQWTIISSSGVKIERNLLIESKLERKMNWKSKQENSYQTKALASVNWFMILFEQTNFEIEWNIVTNLMLTNYLLQSNHKLDLCFTISCHSVVKAMARKQGIAHSVIKISLPSDFHTIIYLDLLHVNNFSAHSEIFHTNYVKSKNNHVWLFVFRRQNSTV